MQKYQFRGRTAVVTGAAGGIGAALTRILAQRGSGQARQHEARVVRGR